MTRASTGFRVSPLEMFIVRLVAAARAAVDGLYISVTEVLRVGELRLVGPDLVGPNLIAGIAVVSDLVAGVVVLIAGGHGIVQFPLRVAAGAERVLVSRA